MKSKNLIVYAIVCLLSSVCLVFLRMPVYEELFLTSTGIHKFEGPAADFKPFTFSNENADEFRFGMQLTFTYVPANFWQDTFQIGSWSEGFRMETNPAGVSGIYTPNREGGLMITPLANFGANQKYELGLNASRTQMEISKNGERRNATISFGKVPPFGNILFGNGYDMKRPFAGRLGNTSIHLETFEYATPAHSGYYFALFVCAAAGLFSGVRVIRALTEAA